ncbi:MAG: MFS transporter [Chromatiaceae bacterium]|nr:MFS transporter [Chromatiaceae bacterium]
MSVIQFFFVTTWVIYIIFLGDLLERVGLGKEYLIWFILLDQAVFAITDILMGYAADRVERFIGRLGPAIIVVTLVSCAAFLLLPFATDLANEVGVVVFTALIVLWIATSSVLRAPPIVLLMKHAARPEAPRLAALSLLGLALGGAVSPYLGLWLKGSSPYLPFIVSSLALAAATLGLTRVQRIVASLPPEARDPGNAKPAGAPRLILLFFGSLLLALGFQLHAFLNSKPQYLQFIEPADLIWVLPVFWIGFKLFALPGSTAARRFGAPTVMAIASLVGAVGLLGCLKAPNLEILLASQLITGGAWGIVFTAGIASALGLGSNGREGLVLGSWFTILSVGTLLRVLLVIGGAKTDPTLTTALQWAPLPLWILAGLALLLLGRRSQPSNAS